MSITEELHIDCPPHIVFDCMADVRNEAEWNDDVSRATMTSEGPVGQGSEFVTVHGAPLGDIASKITTYERPGRLEFSATNKRMDMNLSLTFIPTGSGTTMSLTVVPEPKGVMRALFPLLRPMIRRDMAKQHQNLKSLCEQRAQTPES